MSAAFVRFGPADPSDRLRRRSERPHTYRFHYISSIYMH